MNATIRLFGLALVAASLLGSAACTSSRMFDTRKPAWARELGEQRQAPGTRLDHFETGAVEASTPPPKPPDNSFYQPGSGELLASPAPAIAEAVSDAGEIKLNFQNANLLEVIKVVLGDMLELNYVVDPRVQGAVTMQTGRPLARDDLIPTLELLLRMNDAAMVLDGDVYRVLPLANAVTGVQAPQLGDSELPLPRGFGVRVVPLKYVAAEEMAQILEPFLAGGNNILRTDTRRNVIILAGSGDDMIRMLETIRVFDVDQMKGMSVAMFTPDFVDAKTLGEELDTLLADPQQGLMAGMVRFVVIERLNGLMVVTPRPDYLAQVRRWVDRLDRESGGAGRRLFFYRVQNGKAAEIAEIMNQLFESKDRAGDAPPQLAPGLEPARIGSAPAPEGENAAAPLPPPTALPTAGAGLAVSESADVRFIADEPNNALLILASAQEYRQILAALRQLDVTPMQVLIEVTIAEVTLNDNLQYGVEWFFTNKVGGFKGTGTLNPSAIPIQNLANAFSYVLQGSGSTPNFILSLLAQESNLSIISSPSLLVLNNEEASIRVGEEVPVTTQARQSISNPDPDQLVTTVEYRETGVLLTVKPRVNSSGLVIMEVEQEVSSVPQTSANSLTPTIQQRKVNSTVAVESGDSVILGGLIQDQGDRGEAGIPVLHKVPILGALAGTKSDRNVRTELLVLITPRAVPNRATAISVTDEYRRKLNSLIEIRDADQTPGGTPPAATPPATGGQPPAGPGAG